MDDPKKLEEKSIEALERIGLNKNQIKIFMDLIRNNNSSALEISKRTGIHRSNTYDALRDLIKLGFVKEIIEEKRKLFSAMEPEKILHYLKQQESEIKSVLPYLNDISNKKENKEEVFIIKGVFAIREALYDFLKQKREISVYGASTISFESLGEGFLREFHSERIKKKIPMKHIYDIYSLERVKHLEKMKYTEARFLPKKYSTISSVNICGDTVILIIFTTPLSAIVIKNPAIAETYQKYFEILFRDSKIIR